MLLSKMKEMAETHLNEKITEAVITVPACFNDSQRQTIKDAGVIAGLNVLRVIAEPTAAALAFGLNEKNESERHVLIFDIGGGTSNVSLVDIDGGMFEVLAIAGDPHLGGEDFDNRMVNFFADRFQRKFKSDLRQSPRALRILRRACERAKRTLSKAMTASIICESLYEGHDFMDNISRAMFNSLNDDLFRRTLVPIQQVLHDMNMSKEDVTDIVLIGGSSRILKVQELLQNFFDGKELCRGVDPDEAVAYGAAVQAAIIKGVDSDIMKDTLLLDVTPFSIGIETEGGMMTVLIARNSTIHAKKSQTLVMHSNPVTIKVFEGERTRTRDNHLLGMLELTGIPPALREAAEIEVTLEVNADGIMNISGQDKVTGYTRKMTIKNEKGRLSQAEIDRLVMESERFTLEDEELKEKSEGLNMLEEYCLDAQHLINEEQFARSLKAGDKEKVQNEITKTLTWIEEHPKPQISMIEAKQQEFEDKLMRLMPAAYHGTDSGARSSGGGLAGWIHRKRFQSRDRDRNRDHGGHGDAGGHAGHFLGRPPPPTRFLHPGGGPRVEEVD
jgi:L1 cell adhesion molecule like protein